MKQINQKFGQHVGDDFLFQIANWIDEYDSDSYAYQTANQDVTPDEQIENDKIELLIKEIEAK